MCTCQPTGMSSARETNLCYCRGGVYKVIFGTFSIQFLYRVLVKRKIMF